MSFSCNNEKKKACACDTTPKELAIHRHILEMKTLGDMICRTHHPLELSGRPDGLVVHSDQKEEAVRHTEDIDVNVAANAGHELTDEKGRERGGDTAEEGERVTEMWKSQLEASF